MAVFVFVFVFLFVPPAACVLSSPVECTLISLCVICSVVGLSSTTTSGIGAGVLGVGVRVVLWGKEGLVLVLVSGFVLVLGLGV